MSNLEKQADSDTRRLPRPSIVRPTTPAVAAILEPMSNGIGPNDADQEPENYLNDAPEPVPEQVPEILPNDAPGPVPEQETANPANDVQEPIPEQELEEAANLSNVPEPAPEQESQINVPRPNDQTEGPKR